MKNATPLVSILICTYNRSALLKRAINSVLTQDFSDFELIIIDDCSSDDTPTVISAYQDNRIRYIRNEVNVGSTEGDRAHIRRFVYELMRGQYFVYLCDDDYWSTTTLLYRQVDAFKTHNDVSMVIGGQLHYTINSENGSLPNVEKVPRVEYKDLYTTVLPKTDFFIKSLYHKFLMTSEEFLSAFAENPACRNLIVGATLYSKKHFMAAGVMSTSMGPRWQSGYELLMGPACCGKVIYLDEPAVIVGTKSTNASFQGTQLEHYLDSILSIKTAFHAALASKIPRKKKKFLKLIKRETIRTITQTFLRNTVEIKLHGTLTLCSKENIKAPVQAIHALREYLSCGIIPKTEDIKYLCRVALPNRVLKMRIGRLHF